jgi:hypothetical protein
MRKDKKDSKNSLGAISPRRGKPRSGAAFGTGLGACDPAPEACCCDDQGAFAPPETSGLDNCCGGCACGVTLAGAGWPVGLEVDHDPPPTSAIFGSKPLFSALLLGRLMGLGMARTGPVFLTGPPLPRSVQANEQVIQVQVSKGIDAKRGLAFGASLRKTRKGTKQGS